MSQYFIFQNVALFFFYIFTSCSKTETSSLVYKCPDNSQCIQHQPVDILLFPPRLVRTAASPGRSDRIPGPAAPGLGGLRVFDPPKLPPRRHSLLHVTVLSAHATVSHVSATHEALPQLDRSQLFDSQSQNPCKAPAGTECNPGGYYHITWGGASGRDAWGRLASCYCGPSAAD